MAGDANVGAQQKLSGNRAGGDACRRFTRAGALEDVAYIGASVLGDAGKIRMPGARTGDRSTSRTASVRWRLGRRSHGVLPVDPVAILDRHGDRPADGFACADAGQNLRTIGL